jgi:hypothetical protein
MNGYTFARRCMKERESCRVRWTALMNWAR